MFVMVKVNICDIYESNATFSTTHSHINPMVTRIGSIAAASCTTNVMYIVIRRAERHHLGKYLKTGFAPG